MASWTTGLGGNLWFRLLAVVIWSSVVWAQDDGAITVHTHALQDPPSWARTCRLNMVLNTQPGGPVGVQFTVIPLTPNVGTNGTGTTCGDIHIESHLAPANGNTYDKLQGNQTIAFLSCDNSSSNGFLSPDQMLQRLMKAQLTAIVLYSTDKNICLIDPDAALPYTSIFSMADAGEAGRVLTYLNGTQAVNSVDATISGTAANSDGAGADTETNSGGGSSSSVAMSILYSITGIITLLFLVIIGTGAIRAHRYPERYGPRGGGQGGRPRQSRAKGLARAVLDTIPIVKFGSQQPAKPDPELELDPTMAKKPDDAHVRGSALNAVEAMQDKRATAALEDVAAPAPAPAASPSPSSASASAPTASASLVAAAAAVGPAHPASAAGGSVHRPCSEQNLPAADAAVGTDEEPQGEGCCICTEDFTAGEDVRVLPCNHRFHPYCVDPWLINVSGTCPLCRLDLRPGHDIGRDLPSTANSEGPAPPLALQGLDGEDTHAPHGNRLSRLLDVNRLLLAGAEERIDAIRVAMMQSPVLSADTRPDRPHPSSLTEKLKEKFRVRTRTQPANSQE